jgi:hypothetical protein
MYIRGLKQETGMDVTRSWKTLLALLLLFATSGANCRQYVRQYTQPRILPEAATLEQIAEKVNGNTARVVSAQSTQATLKTDGIPAVKANIALQAPRRLRVQASAFGPQLDMGSNDELFWVWIKQNEPPAVFVCRHDQFAASSARQIMPIEPERLLEAIGLPHIDPTLVLSGPTQVGAQRLEIISRQPSTVGELKKITIIDAWDGMVLEQHVYDQLGAHLATSLTSRYKHDPTTGAAMPRSIEIRWPTAKMAFNLEVTDWVINRIPPENTALWTLPQPEGTPIVDLADPSIRFMDPNAPAGARPPIAPPVSVPNQPVGVVPASPAGQPVQMPSGLSYPAATYPPATGTPLR